MGVSRPRCPAIEHGPPAAGAARHQFKSCLAPHYNAPSNGIELLQDLEVGKGGRERERERERERVSGEGGRESETGCRGLGLLRDGPGLWPRWCRGPRLALQLGLQPAQHRRFGETRAIVRGRKTEE